MHVWTLIVGHISDLPLGGNWAAWQAKPDAWAQAKEEAEVEAWAAVLAQQDREKAEQEAWAAVQAQQEAEKAAVDEALAAAQAQRESDAAVEQAWAEARAQQEAEKAEQEAWAQQEAEKAEQEEWAAVQAQQEAEKAAVDEGWAAGAAHAAVDEAWAAAQAQLEADAEIQRLLREHAEAFPTATEAEDVHVVEDDEEPAAAGVIPFTQDRVLKQKWGDTSPHGGADLIPIQSKGARRCIAHAGSCGHRQNNAKGIGGAV